MSAVVQRESLRQRADYTYKFNAATGRHGWLRLTPAYSLKLVEELVASHPDANRILDPFCGTGTTALSAAYHGHEGVTTDINPFLVWLATAKTSSYSPRDLSNAAEACNQLTAALRLRSVEPATVPPLHNIDRWWSPETLFFLRCLIAGIDAFTRPGSPERNLLHVAFCRILIEQSNAAFNHQSMSFKAEQQLPLALSVDLCDAFRRDLDFVLAGAAENPGGTASVLFADSRSLASLAPGKFDLVVTSPPYANRMSYIRELRPYMYWLGFLDSGRTAGELDWTAIGGTWGVATSRLNDWERPSGSFASRHLDGALGAISHSSNKNGLLLAKYVAKYFDDMWEHFQSLDPLLRSEAEVHYIVGNSTFYGNLVSTEVVYAEMLSALGFRHVRCTPIRKRNSKKELIEFDVSATR